MWSIYTMKIYVTIKRNEELIHDTTWMTLKTLCKVKKAIHERPHIV